MLQSWQFNCPLHSLCLINICAARCSLKSHRGGAKSCRQEMDPPVARRRQRPRSAGATPAPCRCFGGCCSHVRQDGEVHFRESRGSRTKGDGKWQAASERLVVKAREAEMTICRGRGGNRQQPQGASLQRAMPWRRGRSMGRARGGARRIQAGETGQEQAGRVWR